MKKLINNKKIIIIMSLVLALILIITLMVLNHKEPSIDTKYMYHQLQTASDLTTAKLSYTGYTKYKDDGIKFLNRGDFLMTYSATAHAGIDMEKVKLNVNDVDKTIEISIPKAEIFLVKVDPKSIEYYDEKLAIFNFNDKDDANKAQSLAEKKAVKDVKNMGILEAADKQAKSIIIGLLEPAKPEGYSFKVVK